MGLPDELLYSEEHVWVKKEGEQVVIGITDFAQEELGDVVFIELPEVGDEIEVDEPFGSAESVKSVSELYAPVSGTVVEVNDDLEDNPEFINQSPYDKAWMIRVELSDDIELEELLTDDEYLAFTEEE